MAERSKKTDRIPPYLFGRLDELAKEIAKTKKLYNFGVGDPDLPANDSIVELLYKYAKDGRTHRYPDYAGSDRLKQAISGYFEKRFSVKLNPKNEIIVLIGSKEGIAHFPLAYVDEGDTVLVPDPGYPVYRDGTYFAGGDCFFMPLLKENSFLPDIEHHLKKVNPKIVWVNYPNNPTSVTANDDFYNVLIELAHRYGFIIASDAAYIEIYRKDAKAPRSILEYDGAMDVAIEFHSFSKMLNMTGWRIGFAIGNAELIAGLGKIKKSIDSGVFNAIQFAVADTLPDLSSSIDEMNKIYFKRREKVESIIHKFALEPIRTDTTFYIWAEIKDGKSADEKVSELIKEGILTSPGNGFGDSAVNYIRFSLTIADADIDDFFEKFK